MNSKKHIAILAMVAILTLGLTATAAQEAEAEVSNQEDRDAFTGADTAATVTTSPGDIFLRDLDAERSTLSWSAVFGEATGTIVLGDDQDNRLYEWDASATHAIAAQGIDFAEAFDAGTVADLEEQYTHLDSSDSDSASETFADDGVTLESQVIGVTDTAGTSTFDGGTTENWETAYVTQDHDGGGAIDANVFVGVVQESGDFYDGTSVTDAGYQAILPVEDETTEEYDLYLELE